VPRRSKFAVAAEEWLRLNARSRAVSSKELWDALCLQHPELTTASDRRKTPRATCMRDLRFDAAFEVGNGKVALKQARSEVR
jgi:hypothetical protein